jgi:PBP1b-binding outer membrane lipoprotein LpoB
MLKRILPALLLPLILAGCATSFTNLTPSQQTRTTNNVYSVEVEFVSNQQSLRWDSIRPQILVGSQSYDMRSTPLMNNRWEGQILVPASSDKVTYRYRFDYDYNSFGKPKADTALSPEYILRIRPEQPK